MIYELLYFILGICFGGLLFVIFFIKLQVDNKLWEKRERIMIENMAKEIEKRGKK